MRRIIFLFCLSLYVAPHLSAQEELRFPEGCGNPFEGSAIFGEFYEKTIQSSLIEGGSVSSAHVELFAVNRLRKFVAEKYPNPAHGDIIEQHIRAQLCSFAEGKKNLTSFSPEIQAYLRSVSRVLLRDVKKLTAELRVKEKERQKLLSKYEGRMDLIEKAENLAEKEVSGLLAN